MKIGKFIARLIDIKKVHEVPEELKPYIDFKAGLENREIGGNERVAIFNVVTTLCYIPVFLDPGKTISDVEEEIKLNSALIHPESKEIVKRALEQE